MLNTVQFIVFNPFLVKFIFYFVSDATKGTGFAAIKMTALGRPQLLVRGLCHYCSVVLLRVYHSLVSLL